MGTIITIFKVIIGCSETVSTTSQTALTLIIFSWFTKTTETRYIAVRTIYERII